MMRNQPTEHPPTPRDAISLGLAVPTVKSLYMEMRFGDTVLGTGTGFLVCDDQSSHCTFVTNRHNVTGRHQDSGECLSKSKGVPDTVVIYFHKEPIDDGEWVPIALPLYRPTGEPYWIEHPRLGPAADMVALNLSWGSDVAKFPYFLKRDVDRAGILVGPAEPVSVIGYPFGLSSSGRFPLWVTGFMAQEISLITPDHPVFLIDCRARQGQSGSAVVAYRTGNYRTLRDGQVSSHVSPTPAWEFLGIYAGRVNPDSDLGRVWHVSAIEELLAAAEAEQTRREAAAALLPAT